MDGRAFKRTAGKRCSIVPATLAGFRNLSRNRHTGRSSSRASYAVYVKGALGRWTGHDMLQAQGFQHISEPDWMVLGQCVGRFDTLVSVE